MRTRLIVFVFLLGAAAHWTNEGTDHTSDGWNAQQVKIPTEKEVRDNARKLMASFDRALRLMDERVVRAYVSKDCDVEYCDGNIVKGACHYHMTDLPAHHAYNFKVEKATETVEKMIILVNVTSKYYDDPPKTYPLEFTYNKNTELFCYLRYLTC
ncbi:hypothetical protein CAEBREN_04467 [Caenorhabditis brenneri]|uniref:Cystatin domain-containing protein n=1 Tax=Caenorhabditis brenneri TaxID=135651 RepID=G0M830_CAEBE|nr:hypothetical protein CAEBREN_04467 [Caenorhabditis brenneri]